MCNVSACDVVRVLSQIAIRWKQRDKSENTALDEESLQKGRNSRKK